jgi:hypothetical protein
MAFLPRVAALAGRAWQAQGTSASRTLLAQNGQQLRAMGGAPAAALLRCTSVL